MPTKFLGTIEDLKSLILEKGIFGDWSDEGSGKFRFRSEAGGILNFWPRTGTIQCQGKVDPKAELEAIFW
jgi:hypothetical protein